MEKNGHILHVDEEHDSTTRQTYSRRRRIFGLDDVVFFLVIFLVGWIIWCTEVRALIPTQKHACNGSLTVEERAAKILKENPLIGEPTIPTCASWCTNLYQMDTTI